MKGSVRRKGTARNGQPRWELRVYAGLDPVRRPGEEPRQRVKSRSFIGTEREAHRELRKLVKEVEEGRHRGTSGSVAQLVEAWLPGASAGWSPTTDARNRGLLVRHVLPELGSVSLQDLSAARLDAFYGQMLAEGQSPASVRKMHYILRRALATAVRWQWIAANPLAEPPGELPVAVSPELFPPTPERVMRAIEEAQADPAWATFLLTAAATGARRGELCGLRRSDLDVESGSLLFARAAIQVKGGWAGCQIKETKTRRRRRVAIDDATVAALVAHLERAEERSRAGGRRRVADPYIFTPATNLDGSEHVHPAAVSTRWRRFRLTAGLGDTRLHDLRHAHVSELLAGGIDVKTVASRVGHARASMTLDVYGHSIPAGDRKAAELAGRLLSR